MRGIEVTPEDPVDEVVALGVRAADAGFDTVFASCHYNNRDPFVVLDRVGRTTDVRVGPGVVNPYETHPVVLASRVATLAESTGGRVVCGIGAGDRSTLANLGIARERPLARVREAIRVARRVWAGERVTHSGTFEARDAGLNYAVPGSVPVYVGAQGPGMLRLAAAEGDGVLVNAAHPRDVGWAVEQIEAGRADRERSGPLEVVVYASVSVAEDAAAAREAVRPPVAFIVAGAPDRVLERHGIDPDAAAGIGREIEAGRFSGAFERVSGGMIDAFSVAGSPGVVAERFEVVLGMVDGIVVGSPLGPDRAAAVGLLADVFEGLSG